VATDEGKALAQLAESPSSDFDVALVDGTNAKDVDLSVKVKAIEGKNDQGGGLVWRAKDARNYYIARFNHKRRTTSASTRWWTGCGPRHSGTPT
jgi:hypothetical protein